MDKRIKAEEETHALKVSIEKAVRKVLHPDIPDTEDEEEDEEEEAAEKASTATSSANTTYPPLGWAHL